MPKQTSRTWEVLSGPSQDDIVFAILHPDKSTVWTLAIKAKGGEEKFTITVEVDDIWAGTGKSRRTKKRPWNGSIGFSGTTFCSQFTYDLAAQARVSVSYEIGKDIGDLKVSSID